MCPDGKEYFPGGGTRGTIFEKVMWGLGRCTIFFTTRSFRINDIVREIKSNAPESLVFLKNNNITPISIKSIPALPIVVNGIKNAERKGERIFSCTHKTKLESNAVIASIISYTTLIL